jgi:hypothetical protein
MNARNLGLVASVVLIGLGLVMTVAQLRAEPAVEPDMTVAVAAAPIPPYTIITQEMVRSDTMTRRAARDRGAYPLETAAGLMSVSAIAPGDLLTAVSAKPVEDVRYVQDLGLEIVSFEASVDRMVGGKVRPGHLVNLYGTGQDPDGGPVTELIEPRIWVVGVSSSGMPVSQATPQADLTTGKVTYVGADRDRPGTLVTVAVPPAKAVHIIQEVGARRLAPYVTLAANNTADLATPAPMPAGPPAISPPPGTPWWWTPPTPYPTTPVDGYGPGN